MANNCNKTFRDLINDGQAQILGIVSIVPMDDWTATTTYQKLNYVRHNGATYLAKVASNNVEPGVAANWEVVWMLCNYDGGIVIPTGTYPNMTVGKVVNALMWGSKSYDGSSPQTITAADLGLADVYKPQGSIAFSALPATPSADTCGFVWNITNDFTTDSRFIEGAGKQYSAGANVGVIEQNSAYYYDVLGNIVDLSNYAQIDGNYQSMTVGHATSADTASEADTAGNATQLGGVSASQYATINGSYANMSVGAAVKAGKVENALTIVQNGDTVTYDGSQAQTVTIEAGGGTQRYRHDLVLTYQRYISLNGLDFVPSSADPKIGGGMYSYSSLTVFLTIENTDNTPITTDEALASAIQGVGENHPILVTAIIEDDSPVLFGTIHYGSTTNRFYLTLFGPGYASSAYGGQNLSYYYEKMFSSNNMADVITDTVTAL